MKTIVYVDDNPQKIEELKDNLPQYQIIGFENPLEAAEKLESLNYDLMLLDIMMPFMDGFQLYRKVTTLKNFKGQPIFFISETEDEDLMTKALSLGAAELLTPQMPWSVRRQRVENKLSANGSGHIQNGSLTFNLMENTVSGHGHEVELTKKEFLILSLLNGKGSASQDEVIKHVWGGNRTMARNNLSTHLSNLNRKIKPFKLKCFSRMGMVRLEETSQS